MAREAILWRIKPVEVRKNRIRFGDWNVVNASVGMCWEPVSFRDMQHLSNGAMHLDDCINRIDELDFGWDWRNGHHIDARSGDLLIGGNLFLNREYGFLADDDNRTT